MKLKDVFSHTFRNMGRQCGLKAEMFEGRLVVYSPMWHKALSTESVFCRALVDCGYLSERQMLRAARRYRLGATRSGGVIFWQIDAQDVICDGKVMYYRQDCHRDKQHHPTWVGNLLTNRYRWADAESLTSRHCFFGLHLLGHTDYTDDTDNLNSSLSRTVVVVESEKTAVVMSEHYPQCVWLATGGLGNVQVEKFRPLRGHKVIMFPDTDPEGRTFTEWYNAAQYVMQQPFWEGSPPIYVSPLLEQQATAEQKQDKIDLVDFLFPHTDHYLKPHTDTTDLTDFNCHTEITDTTEYFTHTDLTDLTEY